MSRGKAWHSKAPTGAHVARPARRTRRWWARPQAWAGAWLSAMVGLTPSWSHVLPPTDLCASPGFTVAFFNGVWSANTEDGALGALQAVRRLHGDAHRGDPIRYELFYNRTGPDGGASAAQDIAEVFVQRASEIDASGELGRRWEYFWDTALDGDRRYTERLRAAVPSAGLLLSGLYASLAAKAAAGWSMMLSAPPTTVDHAAHRARLDALSREGRPLVLVAHSQGNLFANAAFDHATSIAGPGRRRVAAVHVAPVTTTLRGPHVLADIDMVVHALRLQGLSTVPPANLALPLSAADPTGHTLAGTYLDASRSGRTRIATALGDTMGTLSAAPGTGLAGAFDVTLTWDGAGDIDLHATEPDGTHVHHAARQGSSGWLDADNRLSGGPERYVATCDRDALATGTYRFAVQPFDSRATRRATLQVATAHGGSLLSRTVELGGEPGPSGGSGMVEVLTVTVSRDAAGGLDIQVR